MVANLFRSDPTYQTTRTQTLADPRMSAAQDLLVNRLFGVEGAPGILSAPRAVPLYEQYVAGMGDLSQAAMDRARTQILGTTDPVTGEQVGGTGIGGYQSFLDQAQGALKASTGQYDPTSAAGFRDEFTTQVIDRAKRDIGEQADLQRRNLAAQAVSRGAFGGAREAVERGLISGREQRAVGDVSARLGSEAERYAQQQAQQAFESQQRRQAGAAGQLAGLAGQAQRMGIAELGQLTGFGGMGQAQEQRVLDAILKGQQEQIAQPMEDVKFATGVLAGLPSFGGTQLQTTPVNQPSVFSQLAGLGIAGLGVAGNLGYQPFAPSQTGTPAQNQTDLQFRVVNPSPMARPDYNPSQNVTAGLGNIELSFPPNPFVAASDTAANSPSYSDIDNIPLGDGNPMTRDFDTFLDPQYNLYRYSSSGGPA